MKKLFVFLLSFVFVCSTALYSLSAKAVYNSEKDIFVAASGEENVSVKKGDTFVIDVGINLKDDVRLKSINLDIRYDEDALTMTDASKAENLDFDFTKPDMTEGNRHIASWENDEGQDNFDKIGSFTFRAKSDTEIEETEITVAPNEILNTDLEDVGYENTSISVNIVCPHSQMQKHNKAQSDCKTEGNIEYWYCPECKKYFSDADGNSQVNAESLKTPLAEHKLSRIDEIPADCKNEGKKAHYKCSVCGKLFLNENGEPADESMLNIPPSSNHSYTKKDASYDALASKASCTQKAKYFYSCSVCGAIEKDENHTFEYGEITEHRWDSGSVTKNPTCTQKGIKTFLCQNEGCQQTKTEDIPAKGHNKELTEIKAVPATCISSGSSQYFYCPDCKEYLRADKTTVTTVKAETTPVNPDNHAGESDSKGNCTKCGKPLCRHTGGYEDGICKDCRKGKYLSDKNIEIDISCIYGAKPALTITDLEYNTYSGDKEHKLSRSDYDVQYSAEPSDAQAGAQITALITARGDVYCGSIEKIFTVGRKSIADNDITFSEIYDKVNTGKEIVQTLRIKNGKTPLSEDIDYTAEYFDNKNTGMTEIIIQGKGNYDGTLIKYFNLLSDKGSSDENTNGNNTEQGNGQNEIQPKQFDISKLEVKLSKTLYTYNGKAKEPKAVVTDGDTQLINGKDYIIAYAKNTKIGSGIAVIIGKGKYTGTISKDIKIVPPAVKNLKVSYAKSTSAKLTWSKIVGASGYRVEIYKADKLIYKTKTSKSCVLVSKLSKGREYTAVISAYAKIDGKTFYGNNSYMNVRTKK